MLIFCCEIIGRLYENASAYIFVVRLCVFKGEATLNAGIFRCLVLVWIDVKITFFQFVTRIFMTIFIDGVTACVEYV